MSNRKNITEALVVAFCSVLLLAVAGASESKSEAPEKICAGKSTYQRLLYREDRSEFYRVWKSYETAIQELDGINYAYYIYDIESGWELSYHENDRFYSASAIKAPYVISVIEQDASALKKSKPYIDAAITVSDNDSYVYLRKTYGEEVFEEWLQEIDCGEVEKEYNYANVTAKEMGKMWLEIYDFLESDREGADYCGELLANVSHSFLLEELGEDYTVYSKGGWIGEGSYWAENDAGAVLCADHPYVIAVLSTAYTQTEKLGTLAEALDGIHDLVVCDTAK